MININIKHKHNHGYIVSDKLLRVELSGAQYVTSMYKALGLITSTEINK